METITENKKRVILTIDTEGPLGEDPVLYQIWGKVGSKYYGVPKIIEICNKYNVKGLFFVDIPEIWDMGYQTIKEVILYIKEQGHDVGVHIHPHHIPNETRHFLFDYTKEEQYQIINNCTKKYVEITGEYPKSFRAGKYGANRDTLDILDELGYKYDFSEFYSQKWCGIVPEINYILPVRYRKIVEIPVTIFRSVKFGSLFQRYDKLEATNNFFETRHVVNMYANTGNNEIIVLFLHSFSFLNFIDHPNSPGINKRNLTRFKKTMNYIFKSDKLHFICEDDLSKIEVVEEDSKDNIVTTKGYIRQFCFLYSRAFSIIKTNTKARILVGLTVCFFIAILFVFMIIM